MLEFHPCAPNDKSFKLAQRGNDLFERHLYLDATHEYTKAIDHSGHNSNKPFLALLYSNRSASYWRSHQYEKARDDAERAMELAPTWGKGYFRYAEALLRLHEYDKALEYYQLALEKSDNHAEISAHIAKAVIEKDNHSMGLSILQLIPGRDIAIERHFRNPIQNRIYEFAHFMRNIIYVVADEDTKQCVVVDACWDMDGIFQMIEKRGYTIVAAVVTHYHFDHVGGTPPPPYDNIPIRIAGLATLLKKLPHIKAYVHLGDIPFIRQANPSISANRLVATCTNVTDTLTIGKRTRIRFLHTPGHTPGSQSLLINDARLIAGDTLLCGLCGRTDLPGGDRKIMEHTLREVLGKLDDRIVVFPGHDYGSEWSTIGIEREKGCLGEDLVGFGMETPLHRLSISRHAAC
ncbi:beta-lactamase-like protein [Radiomyces spectabilis]|uniref:beta-lactamase-like protein n=1 Tax=Radiomyces spectabilis TaxID=64574 RepID=UPI002220F49D|nr:beta-lactamase-like protein [Radiomyces spectabilis]KAI8388259.1 beta-lactamase-like protein [Radiomyces spectabilis]